VAWCDGRKPRLHLVERISTRLCDAQQTGEEGRSASRQEARMRVQIGLLDIHFSSVKDESHLFAGSRKTWSLPGISRTRASTGLDGFRKKLLHISFDLIVASSKLKWIGKNLGRVGCNLKGGQQKPAPLQPGPDRSQLEAEMDRQKPGQDQLRPEGGQ